MIYSERDRERREEREEGDLEEEVAAGARM